MSIEFHCQKCHNLLRTPDDTAGKPAKCPQCREITLVPSLDADELGLAPEAPRGPLGPQQPANIPPANRPPSGSGVPPGGGGVPPATPGGSPVPPFGAPADPANPFASPGYTGEAGYGGPRPMSMDEGDRNGPPWERDGASPGSWFATVKEIFSGPSTTFRHMRRTGGIAAPLWFGVIGGTLGGWAQILYDLIVGLVTAPAPPPQFGGNQPPFVDFMQGGAGIFESICGAVLMPIFAATGLFIIAGVVHLMLMMLDGARHGFEATFRSIAYVSGTTSLLQIIPFCGQIGLVGQAGACFSLILLVVQIVFFILALIEMQGTSGGKATAAVLLPFVICCGLCCGLIALFSIGAAGALR